MQAADADSTKSASALKDKFGLLLIPRVPKKLVAACDSYTDDVTAAHGDACDKTDAAGHGESNHGATVSCCSWQIEVACAARNQSDLLLEEENAALMDLKGSRDQVIKAAKDAARKAAERVLQQTGLEPELLASIVLPSPEKAVVGESMCGKPGPLSPRSRFHQNELLAKRGVGVAAAASSRHTAASKKPIVEALVPKALHFRASQPRLRRSNNHYKSGAELEASLEPVAFTGNDEEEGLNDDHSDAASRHGDDDDVFDNDDCDGNDDQTLAQSSNSNGRSAKQAAQVAIKSATRNVRVKGFKSPKIPQYKSRKPVTRKWDPAARKYHYFSKTSPNSASDQPQAPPRSHKKASPATVTAASPPVVVAAPAAPSVPLTYARTLREKSERSTSRASGVSPKAIQFDDKAGSTAGKGAAAAAATMSEVAAVSAAAVPAAVEVASKADKVVSKEKKSAAPSARAVGVMPKVIRFDGDDDEASRLLQQQADHRAPAMFAYVENLQNQQLQQPHDVTSQPLNYVESLRKPAPSQTPHKRTRSSLASPPTLAPMTSPRKRMSMACPPSNSYETFEEEFAAIVAAEKVADPSAEAKLKAFAEFFMGGVVERAELAKKCVSLLSSLCFVCDFICTRFVGSHFVVI